MDKVKQVLKTYRMLFICIIIALVAMIAYTVVSNVVFEKRLDAVQTTIEDLTGEIETVKVTNRESVNQTASAVTGLDTKRVNTDDALFEAFIKKCFNWKSAAEYNQIRSDLEADGTVGDNSNFLTIFFPELTDDSQIDDGVYGNLNLSFKSMNSNVVNIQDDVYSYFTEVTVVSEVNGSTAEGSVVVTYDVTKDGTLSNVNAYNVVQ